VSLNLEHFDTPENAPVPQQGGSSELAKVNDGALSLRIDSIDHKPGSRQVQGGGKENGSIITAHFTVIGGPQDGLESAQQWWVLNRQDADRFSGDLQAMGFDSENWHPKNGRPFSKEVEKALKLMPGLQLDAEKNSRERDDAKNKGSKSHYLNIKGRTLDPKSKQPLDGKPDKFTAAQLDEAVADAFS
jgi:hypothetical protein